MSANKMLKTKLRLAAVLMAVLAGGLLSGCAGLDRGLLAPGEVTVERQEVVTAEVRDGQATLRTNHVEVPVTNWVVSPAVQGGLEMAGVVAGATPWGAVAAPILGTVSALLGWYATMRNKKYREAALALSAVIRGVEASAEILGEESGGRVKAAIRNEAESAGVQPVLHRAVRELT